MSGLAAVVARRRGPGAYRWAAAYDVDRVRHVLAQADWALAHLEGVGIGTVAELHDALAGALDLPAHYGRNLDALHDVLRDVPADTLLLWDDWGGFARAEPKVFAVVCELVGERHVLLLRGPGPDVALPELD